MRGLWKAFRYSGVGTFCAGIVMVIQGCSLDREGALGLILLLLLQFCSGPVADLGDGDGGATTPPFTLMYYSTNGAVTGVQRANLDGTGSEILICAPACAGPNQSSAFSSILGIALDLNAGHIYIPDDSNALIVRTALDGSGFVNRICRVGPCTGGTVDSEFDQPTDITLDLAAGKMYWVDSSGVVGERVKRANLDGSGSENLVCQAGPCTGGNINADMDSPRGIALDIAAGKMYWTNGNPSNRIMRANLDGSSSENILCNALCAGGEVNAAIDSPTYIALDIASGKMYWTDRSADHIMRANLDGTGSEILICQAACGQINADVNDPRGIALDLARSKMYWANVGSDRIMRANLDGSGSENVLCAAACAGGQVDASVADPEGFKLAF